MSSSWKVCLLLMVALTTCIHEGLSIKCWDCRSDIEPSCGDQFDNSTLLIVDCNSRLDPLQARPVVCRVIRQRVNENWTIIRGCAYLPESEIVGNGTSCSTRTIAKSVVEEHCTCDHKDGCNTGPTIVF